MQIIKESIFISAIRSFFSTLLGTLGIFIAIIPIFIFISIISSDKMDIMKTKMEIVPDHLGNSKILPIGAPVILNIDIQGVIGIDNGIKAEDIQMQLLDSRKGFLKNNRVKAILLNMNTPGGSVIDSDIIYRKLLEYKKTYNVPIYAYVDGMCASGGMWVASSCDVILSSYTSIIGSVGVFNGPFFNFFDAMEKYGIKSKTIFEGKDKIALSPFKKWQDNEGDFYKNITLFYYNMFVDIVSKARNIDKTKLVNEYGAHVFDPVTAEKIGYIDKANLGYNEAIIELSKKASIDIEKPYQIVSLTVKKKWPLNFKSKLSTFLKSLIIETISSESNPKENQIKSLPQARLDG